MILIDLKEGILPLDEQEMSAQEAWETCYKYLPEFVSPGVTFEQFEARLKDHRKQVSDKMAESAAQMQAYQHDLSLFPRKMRNQRGERVFDLHPAKPLLREDIRMKKHTQMKPSELRMTCPEYQDFKPKIFEQRVYQEVRRQKFLFYIGLKRAEKLRKQRARREDMNPMLRSNNDRMIE